jgi:hypothetical protein
VPLVVVELDELGLELGVEEDRLGRGDQILHPLLRSSSASSSASQLKT